MKRIFKRLLAYMIDMMVVLIIVQSLTGVEAINKQLPKYTKYYDEYAELTTNYGNFRVKLESYFEDEKITEKEYNKLVEQSSTYQEEVEKYYDDQKITKKEYNKIIEKLDQDYQKDYEKVYYQIEKNSILYLVLYLVVVLLYFGIFNKITKGQTLGKKLLRLKIVNAKDREKEVSIVQYVIRAVLVYQLIYYVVRLIGVFTFGQSNYYSIVSFVYNIQYYIEMAILLLAMIRVDGRGLHDLVSGTKVILLDRNGEEIADEVSVFAQKKMEILKEKESKTIVEEPKEE